MQDESGMHLTQSSSTKKMWVKLCSPIKCFHGMKPNNRAATTWKVIDVSFIQKLGVNTVSPKYKKLILRNKNTSFEKNLFLLLK